MDKLQHKHPSDGSPNHVLASLGLVMLQPIFGNVSSNVEFWNEDIYDLGSLDTLKVRY